MLFKTKNPSSAMSLAPAQQSAAAATLIDADMTVHGNLKSPGDLQVEGIVIGDIETNRLVIAEDGRVSGNVTAQNIRVCGVLNGTVRGAMVTLTATARVRGDVHHELLSIETGGQLEGHCRRLVTEPDSDPRAPFSAGSPVLFNANPFVPADDAEAAWE